VPQATREKAQKGGLARPVAPDKPDSLTRFDAEIEIFEEETVF